MTLPFRTKGGWPAGVFAVALWASWPAMAATVATAVEVEGGGRRHVYLHGHSSGLVFNVPAVGVTAGGTPAASTEFVSESWAESAQGRASATVNPSTGSFGVYAAASGLALEPSYALASTTGSLRFSVAGADDDTLTIVHVYWTQTGLVSAELDAYWTATFSYQGEDMGGGFSRSVTFDTTPGASLQDDSAWEGQAVALVPGEGYVSTTYDYAGNDRGELVVHGVMLLVGADPVVSFSAGLGAGCGSGTTCNFLDAAQLSLGLPAGVLLQGDPSIALPTVPAVPEPGTSVLLLAGALGLMAAARVGRRSDT